MFEFVSASNDKLYTDKAHIKGGYRGSSTLRFKVYKLSVANDDELESLCAGKIYMNEGEYYLHSDQPVQVTSEVL